MVGVPGRSKGCLTCRTRKKGCDLGKPTCAVCKKAGLECRGYSTQPVFVVSTPRSRHAGYSVSAAPDPAGSPWPRRPLRKQDAVAGHITDPHLLARPEYERRCIDLFWEAYFPSGRPLPVAISRSYTCTWTETARKLYREDDSLRYALWANCLLITGRRHGAAWMLRESPRMYGRALADLRRSLGLSRGAKKDASIATVKLLGMFEAFSQQCTGLILDDQQQHWQRHHDGELALFLARTPAAHISGNAHHVFADERVDMALFALLQRKQLPISTPEWKSTPWREIPKDLKDMLVDVLVDMPGLVEQHDQLRLCPDPARRAARRRELLHQCREHDRQLAHWLNIVSQLDTTIPRVLPPNHDRDLRLVTHVARVHGMALFFTTGLVLYSIMVLATAAAGSGSPEAGWDGSAEDGANLPPPPPPPPQRLDPLHYARRLAETVPALLQPAAGLYGQQSAALPLEVALRFTAAMPLAGLEGGRAVLERLRELRRELGRGLVGEVHG